MSSRSVPADPRAPCTVVVFAARDRMRALAKHAFPRRRTRLVLVRRVTDFASAFRRELVDLSLIDLGAPSDATAALIPMAREYPSVPFVGVTPLRLSDAAIVGRCLRYDFADVVVESVDDPVVRDVLLAKSFTWRFADALREPPPALGLNTPMRLEAWRFAVAQGGRPVSTESIATRLGVTREHLSRAFSSDGAPNLKRVIDLVRILGAAELAKNPGYDIRDVARVLGFASSSHLSTTAQRIVGVKPSSLSRLRSVDLIARFAASRTRSRRTRSLPSGRSL